MIRLTLFSGDQSDLHVIIFDEIDAICKVRGCTIESHFVNCSLIKYILSEDRLSEH